MARGSKAGVAAYLKVMEGKGWALCAIRAPLNRVAVTMLRSYPGARWKRNVGLSQFKGGPDIALLVQPKGAAWSIVYRAVSPEETDDRSAVESLSSSLSKSLKTDAIWSFSEAGAIEHEFLRKGLSIEKAAFEKDGSVRSFQSNLRPNPKPGDATKAVDDLFKEHDVLVPRAWIDGSRKDGFHVAASTTAEVRGARVDIVVLAPFAPVVKGLVNAVRDLDVAVVRKLIAAGADLEEESHTGTPLWTALPNTMWQEQRIAKGLEIMELLLKAGAPVASRRFGSTILEKTASLGVVDAAKILIRAGAELTPHAIYSAAEAGHVDLVQLLIEHDLDPFAPAPPTGGTPYQAAKEKGQQAVVSYLDPFMPDSMKTKDEKVEEKTEKPATKKKAAAKKKTPAKTTKAKAPKTKKAAKSTKAKKTKAKTSSTTKKAKTTTAKKSKTTKSKSAAKKKATPKKKTAKKAAKKAKKKAKKKA